MIGRWHDYGSGNHGDMLKLIREHQGLGFTGALDYARSYLGMPQPDYAQPMSGDERTFIAERLQARERERAEVEAAEQRRIEAGICAGRTHCAAAMEMPRGSAGAGRSPLHRQ